MTKDPRLSFDEIDAKRHELDAKKQRFVRMVQLGELTKDEALGALFGATWGEGAVADAWAHILRDSGRALDSTHPLPI